MSFNIKLNYITTTCQNEIKLNLFKKYSLFFITIRLYATQQYFKKTI